MPPTHTDADESVSGRRRKPSRSPELSSPRPSKRHEPHYLSGSSYDNEPPGMENFRRLHGQSNRLPWSRQGESSRNSAGDMTSASERHFDSGFEYTATMLANKDGTRDHPADNANVIQSKRRDFPLNAPTLPAADRDIAPSQHDLRVPHAIIEVVTTDDLPLRDSIDYLKKMLRGEGGCKQLTKVCWNNNRFYAIFKNTDKGQKEASACNAICKINDLRLFNQYRLMVEKGSFGNFPRRFSLNRSNDRNENARTTRHDRSIDVTHTLGRPTKPYGSSMPIVSQCATVAQMNGNKTRNDIPSGNAWLSQISSTSPPLPPLSHRTSSASRNDEQSSLHSVATSGPSEPDSKKEKLCARCKKPRDDRDLFVRCSSCKRGYHDSCSLPPVVGDVDRSIWQCFRCNIENALASTTDVSGPPMRNQNFQRTSIPGLSSNSHTTSESQLPRGEFSKSLASIERVNDEDRRHSSSVGVIQPYQINADKVSDGSRSMDTSSTSSSPSHGTKPFTVVTAVQSHKCITEDPVENSKSMDSSPKAFLSRDDTLLALDESMKSNQKTSEIQNQDIDSEQWPQYPSNDMLFNAPTEPQHSGSSTGQNKFSDCENPKLSQTLEVRTEEQDHPTNNNPITSKDNAEKGFERQRSSESPSANNQNDLRKLVATKPFNIIQEREIRLSSPDSDLRSTSHPVQDKPISSAAIPREGCHTERPLTAESSAKDGSAINHSPTSTPNCQKCGRKAFSRLLCYKCKQDEEANFQAEILAGLDFNDIAETANVNKNEHIRAKEESNTVITKGNGGGYAPLESPDGEEAGSPIGRHNARNDISVKRRSSEHNPYSFLRNPGNNPAAKKFSQSSSWYRPPSLRCIDCLRHNLPCTHDTQSVEARETIAAQQAKTTVEGMSTMQPEGQPSSPKPSMSCDLPPNEKKDCEVRNHAARKTAPDSRPALSISDTEDESSDSTPKKFQTWQLPREANWRRETHQPTSIGSTNMDVAPSSKSIEWRVNPTACLDCARKHKKCTHIKKPQNQQKQNTSKGGKQQMASIPRNGAAESTSAASLSQSNLSGSFSGPPTDKNSLDKNFGGSRFAPNGISKPPAPTTTTEVAAQPMLGHGAHSQGNSLGATEMNSPTSPRHGGDSLPNVSNAEEGDSIDYETTPASSPASTPNPADTTFPRSNRVLHVKPNLSWNDLIYLALSRANDGKLTSIDIAEWIQKEVPGYKNDPRVKPSISAMLSMHSSKCKCLLYAKAENPNRLHNGTRFVGPRWIYQLKPLHRTHFNIEYIERVFLETRARDGRIPVDIPIPPTNRYVQPSYTEPDEHADNMPIDLRSRGDGTAEQLGENGRIGDGNEEKNHDMRKNLVAIEDGDESTLSSDSIPLSRRYARLPIAASQTSASQLKVMAHDEPVKTKKSPGLQWKSSNKFSRIASPVEALQHKPLMFSEESSASNFDSGIEADIHGQPAPMKQDHRRPRKSTSILSTPKRDRATLSMTLSTHAEKNKAPVSTAETNEFSFRAPGDNVEMEVGNLHAPSYIANNKIRPRIASPNKDSDTEQRGYFSGLEDNPTPPRPHPSLGDPNFVAPNILDEFPETRERELKQNAEELAYFKHWDEDPRYSKNNDFGCRNLFARRPDLHPDNMREGFDDEGKIKEIKARQLGRGDVQRWRRHHDGERMSDLNTSRRFRDPKTWWKDQGTKKGGWFDESDGDDEGEEEGGPGANKDDRMEVDETEKYIESGEKRFKSVKELLELPDQNQLELGLDKIGELVFREKSGFNVSGRVKRGRKEFKTGHPDGLDL